MRFAALINNLNQADRGSHWRALWSGQGWRRKAVDQTLSTILDPTTLSRIYAVATQNLSTWQSNNFCSSRVRLHSAVVSVVSEDCCSAALRLTRETGAVHAILNMAHPSVPGGDFLHFGSAQEESLWARSTCALSLADADDVYFDYARLVSSLSLAALGVSYSVPLHA
jgi:uncharacterized protein (TIGR02452 family)